MNTAQVLRHWITNISSPRSSVGAYAQVQCCKQITHPLLRGRRRGTISLGDRRRIWRISGKNPLDEKSLETKNPWGPNLGTGQKTHLRFCEKAHFLPWVPWRKRSWGKRSVTPCANVGKETKRCNTSSWPAHPSMISGPGSGKTTTEDGNDWTSRKYSPHLS